MLASVTCKAFGIPQDAPFEAACAKVEARTGYMPQWGSEKGVGVEGEEGEDGDEEQEVSGEVVGEGGECEERSDELRRRFYGRDSARNVAASDSAAVFVPPPPSYSSLTSAAEAFPGPVTVSTAESFWRSAKVRERSVDATLRASIGLPPKRRRTTLERRAQSAGKAAKGNPEVLVVAVAVGVGLGYAIGKVEGRGKK